MFKLCSNYILTMFKFNLIAVLVIIAALSCRLIEATTAFYKVSLFINPTSTTTIYFSVEANVVTGVFDSLLDLNFNTNNVIAVGGYASNDNKFVYRVGSPFDITTEGISFKNAGAYFSLSLDTTVSPPALSLSSNLGFFVTNIIPTVTFIPIQYYILTISEIPVSLHYIAVISKRVVGVYLSVADTRADTNNLLIAQGSAFGNDNQLDNSVGAPSYGISASGVSFYLSSNNGCVLYYVVSTSPPSFRVVSTLNPYGAVTATVTPLLPTAYYILTINTNPIIKLYLSAVFTNIVGVYDTLADTNWPALNHLLPVGDLYGNDNILNYTAGAPYYGITDGGISFTTASEGKTNIFNGYNDNTGLFTLYLVSDFGFNGPTTATVTTITIPISYYILTISSTPLRVFYITVATAQVTGVYASLDDMYALDNNLVLQPQAYKNNDNNFDYTASAPYFGLTHSGVSFLLDGNDANLYLLPLMYPSLFLYFDYGGLVYNIPVTVTVESISPTSTPTSIPTTTPTALPTKSPTHTPSHTPSKQPSRAPIRAPTKAPTKAPSRQPTHTPTHTPTRVPTV